MGTSRVDELEAIVRAQSAVLNDISRQAGVELGAQYSGRGLVAMILTAERLDCAQFIMDKYGNSRSHGHLAMLAEDVASTIRSRCQPANDEVEESGHSQPLYDVALALAKHDRQRAIDAGVDVPETAEANIGEWEPYAEAALQALIESYAKATRSNLGKADTKVS